MSLKENPQAKITEGLSAMKDYLLFIKADKEQIYLAGSLVLYQNNLIDEIGDIDFVGDQKILKKVEQNYSELKQFKKDRFKLLDRSDFRISISYQGQTFPDTVLMYQRPTLFLRRV